MPQAKSLLDFRLEPAISQVNEHVDFNLLFFILSESLGNDDIPFYRKASFHLEFHSFLDKLISTSI